MGHPCLPDTCGKTGEIKKPNLLEFGFQRAINDDQDFSAPNISVILLRNVSANEPRTTTIIHTVSGSGTGVSLRVKLPS